MSYEIKIDYKSALSHKTIIFTYINKYIKQYQTENHTITITDHAKNQIVYIYYKFIKILHSFIKTNINIDTISPHYVICEIENTLSTCSTKYRVCSFIKGIIKDRKLYHEDQDNIDIKIKEIINKYVENDYIMPYVTDAFLIFLKQVAKSISNNAWAGNTKINNITMNALLRNMNFNDVNPDLFNRIFNASSSKKN